MRREWAFREVYESDLFFNFQIYGESNSAMAGEYVRQLLHIGDFRWQVENNVLPDSRFNLYQGFFDEVVKRKILPGRWYRCGSYFSTPVRNAYLDRWYKLDIVGNKIWSIGSCFVVEARPLASDILVHRLWLKGVPLKAVDSKASTGMRLCLLRQNRRLTGF